MKQYLDLMQNILENGEERDDRTGTGTIGIFGYQMRFDLNKGFPLLTTKKLHLKSIIHELLWFISGSTNISYLHKNGVTIWDEWASETTENVGRMYGYQWRNFGGHVDQLKDVILELKNDPYGRRHLVTAWNPEDVRFGKCCLPPCHVLFQFYVDKNNRLSCQLYQRSADVFLGVPFNIASYSLLTMMVAQCCGYGYGEFIHVLGDAHIYKNHLDQARLQLRREPKELPKMTINPDKKDINTFVYEDFYLSDYRPHPHIKAEVSV